MPMKIVYVEDGHHFFNSVFIQMARISENYRTSIELFDPNRDADEEIVGEQGAQSDPHLVFHALAKVKGEKLTAFQTP